MSTEREKVEELISAAQSVQGRRSAFARISGSDSFAAEEKLEEAEAKLALAKSELLALREPGEPVAWLLECMIRGGSNFMVDDVVFDKVEADEYLTTLGDHDRIDVRVRGLYLTSPSRERDDDHPPGERDIRVAELKAKARLEAILGGPEDE